MARNAVDSLTGKPVNVIGQDFDVRAYLERPVGDLREVREGFTPEDMGMGKPGYAGIVICEEKIR